MWPSESSPGTNKGVLAFRPRFQLASSEEERRLLCGFASTSRQTRSGSGTAKASGQDVPLIRALVYSLVCCPQARFRTFPGNDVLGTRGDGIYWIKIGCQKGRVQVALHRPNSTGTGVPALRERLFHRLAAAMTPLGEPGAACGNFGQGAARACNGASEHFYKHPWSPKSYASPKAFLPRLIRNLFEEDGGPHGHELMHVPSMQALAMGGELAFSGGFALPGFLVARAAFPDHLLLAALLDAALLVVVLRVARSPLPVHLALQATDGLRVRFEFFTEDRQTGLALTRHDGDAGWPQVQPDGIGAYRVLRLVVGHPFQRQLHAVAVPLAIGSSGSLAGSTPFDQPRIFDAMS